MAGILQAHHATCLSVSPDYLRYADGLPYGKLRHQGRGCVPTPIRALYHLSGALYDPVLRVVPIPAIGITRSGILQPAPGADYLHLPVLPIRVDSQVVDIGCSCSISRLVRHHHRLLPADSGHLSPNNQAHLPEGAPTQNTTQQMEVTTHRFISAVTAIAERGISINEMTIRTGIDRRNLMRLINDPEHHYPRPMWMSALCEHYHISARYLLLGRGGVFDVR